jgi:5-methylcytosine-specific restriction endonuclease McrA
MLSWFYNSLVAASTAGIRDAALIGASTNVQNIEAKRCVKCREWKLLSAFSRSAREKDGLQEHCKQCAAAYFQAKRAKIILQVRARKARLIDEARQAVRVYLTNHPCVDCGETDPVVLEFDHVRGRKRSTVERLVYQGYGLRVVMSEIEKCDVRCANCHRRKTARELGWYRWVAVNSPAL